MGREFLQRHLGTLLRAQARYGVPPEEITAVVRYETNFGINLGKSSARDTLQNLGKTGQVRCLERLFTQERWDPNRIVMGSERGAIGVTQFMPCSYVAYGVDGNGDGKVDPFNVDDAVMSTGNFLAIHGWRKGMEAEALWHYNKDKAYGKKILAFARVLRESASTELLARR